MSTINFSVDVSPNTYTGTLSGGGIKGSETGYIGTYYAGNATGYALANNEIFCIAPTLIAASGNSTYNVVSGISEPGLSASAAKALEGLFSHFYNQGINTALQQEEYMIADWLIVDPKLTISDLSNSSDVNSKNPLSTKQIVKIATNLAANAEAGDYAIDPHLKFSTLINTSGCNQNFINIDPVPLPASVGLFMTALVVLAGIAMKKKAAQI